MEDSIKEGREIENVAEIVGVMMTEIETAETVTRG